MGLDVNVKVSSSAAEQIRKLQQVDGKEGWGLRVGVKSGGCSGLSYYMDFIEAPLANDHVIEQEGVKLYVDVFSAMYLNDSVLEFSDGLNGTGFEWKNPNAQRTCGCGQSFSA